jgi:hypothetical protein
VSNGHDQALDAIADQPPPVGPDVERAAKAEEVDYDLEKKKTELKSLSQDIEARKKYAKGTFVLICVWLGFVFYVILAQGFKTGFPGFLEGFLGQAAFELSDAIMIALITTTTASVIGILLIVMSYLFPRRG